MRLVRGNSSHPDRPTSNPPLWESQDQEPSLPPSSKISKPVPDSGAVKAPRESLPPGVRRQSRPAAEKERSPRGWEVTRRGSDFSWTEKGGGEREVPRLGSVVLQGVPCRVVRGRGETGARVAALTRTVRLARGRAAGKPRSGYRPALRGEYEVAIGTGEDNPSHLGRLMGLRIGVGAGRAGAAGGAAHLDGLELLRDSAYFIPHYESSGESARGAGSAEAALRAMGVVQGLLLQEEAVEHAAHSANLPPEVVRTVNLYQKGSCTPEGRPLDECRLDEVWRRIATLSHFHRSRDEVDAFNASHRNQKRGISMIPLKHGGEPGRGGAGETYSAACTVVEIDALSGSVAVLRADLVHDPGPFPSPVSAGLLKRAYLQGLGYLLSEEVSLQPVRSGRGAGGAGGGRYEAPLPSTLPIRLNVEIVRSGEAPEAAEAARFAFSEETCEPALALAVTAYFAVRQAIRAVRKGRGLEEWGFVAAPLTEDIVRQACRPTWPRAGRKQLTNKEDESKI